MRQLLSYPKQDKQAFSGLALIQTWYVVRGTDKEVLALDSEKSFTR